MKVVQEVLPSNSRIFPFIIPLLLRRYSLGRGAPTLRRRGSFCRDRLARRLT